MSRVHAEQAGCTRKNGSVEYSRRQLRESILEESQTLCVWIEEGESQILAR